MPIRVWKPQRFVPTIPRSGEEGDGIVFRGENFIIRGLGALSYLESYAGSFNLSEPIATGNLTGTVAVDITSEIIVGTGTAFTSELHLGQFILAYHNGESTLLVVKSVTDDTHFVTYALPFFTASGLTAARLPVLYAVGIKRGTSLTGNVIQLDLGTLLSAGSGTFRQNGSAISASLTLTRSPKISLFDSGAGTYTNFTLGMDTPAAGSVAAAAVASSGLGMQAGNYSIVVTPARQETLGYNNPSERVDVTLTDGDAIEITFPAMDTTNGQNAWIVWGTLYSDSLGADLNYLEGPWHKVILLTTDDVPTGGGTFTVEWLDAQIERQDLVTFDNDPPADAEFVAMLNNVPVWISTNGPGDTSPGPFIIPAKPNNIEAAPQVLAFSASPPETIYGVVSSTGRLYLLTDRHLQVAIGTPSDITPIIIQPFWFAGFTGPGQVCFVNGRLYGFPVSGPTRSASEGVPGSEEKQFAAAVQEITKTWNPAHVRVAHDPKNDCVCFFHSADSLNDDGFWTTLVLLFGLPQDDFIGAVRLSSSTTDLLVSGVDTVGTNLEFLAGGRKSDNSIEVNSFVFDEVAGEVVAWFAASSFSDNQSERRNSTIKAITVTANIQDGSFGVFTSGPTQAVPVAQLETGNSSSTTGAVAIPNSSADTLTQRTQVNCPNARLSALRIEGEYDGVGTLDRIDEAIIEYAIIGART